MKIDSAYSITEFGIDSIKYHPVFVKLKPEHIIRRFPFSLLHIVLFKAIIKIVCLFRIRQEIVFMIMET